MMKPLGRLIPCFITLISNIKIPKRKIEMRKINLLPDVEELKKMFYLDPTIPEGLRWKVDRLYNKTKNRPAGGLKGPIRKRYYSTRINGKLYKNHKIIYSLFHNINLQSYQIVDHIDRNSKNNNPDNLRIVTAQENTRNRTKQSGTSSMYKGVTFDKSTKKWQAQIMMSGKQIYLGLFHSETDAAITYNRYILDNGLTHFNLNIVK